ncbi:MAG: hypothetical protein B6D77_08235 [gamma proteobacterium symbiont of Ctena orbiculata]|nr:MAG: hypothetical protein B6D77_08235 [gamma proteobacterium symbiont of Ctena orbiculata]PVV19692.1 MAG: hypothetical protein B6D78_12870 [gamma proteobacterium symbiont of Ctena orbiculata]PVV26863.1 MAG: hypothetical protein B6D79_04920 [gamma proteobacterium symbiont of Ctena orbiculata]
MNYLRALLAVTLYFSTPIAISEEILIDTPMAATTLQFADRYASIFYMEGEESYKVILAFSTGQEENEQLVRQSLYLADGQSYQLSIGGYGADQKATTIKMKRENEYILADVVTCDSREKIANCI